MQHGWKIVRGGQWIKESAPLHAAGQGYRQLMTNIGDAQYITNFQLGDQTVAIVLDTGSFELVVFSTDCSTCGQAAKYDPALSGSHNANRKFVSGQYYGSGQTWSQEASDLIMVGPYGKVNQTFWEVLDAKMPVLRNAYFNAILGLGPPEAPATDAAEAARKLRESILSTRALGGEVDSELLRKAREKSMVAERLAKRSTVLKTVNASRFSVCMGKEPKADGVFVWNDTSVDLYPDFFQRVPVIGNHTWSISLRNARLGYLVKDVESPADTLFADNSDFEDGAEHLAFDNSTSIHLGCEDGCGALVDSGTSLLAVPRAVISELVGVMRKENLNCSNMWELPHLVFEMGDQTFSLPPDSYIAEVGMQVPSYMQSLVRIRSLGEELQRPGAYCELVVIQSVARTDAGPLWILGMPFFRRYYTTFSLGHNKSDRAVYFAGASPSCTPVKRRVAIHDGPPSMWKRVIDPFQLWMPLSAQLAASAPYVHL